MSKYENFFTDLANTTPYFKAAAEGAAGSGKTFSLALIAAGLYKYIKSTKPIIIFDTEKSAKFLKPFFGQHKIEVLLKDSRTLTDLTATMDFCDEGNADILMIDSITHVWEGFLNAYQQKKGRTYLQFQDWGQIKPMWRREYSDRLVMGRYHILFTGREGFTYDNEINEDTGKKELIKTGVKMKVEGDTAYEPDLLIRMERFEEILSNGKPKRVWREATVIKDRANLIDGKVFENPTFEHFRPVIEFLLSDVHSPVITQSTTDHGLFETEEDNQSERRECKIMLERNEALLNTVAAGTTGEAKSLRLSLMDQAYVGETSETAIARMNIEQLRDANDRLAGLVKIINKVRRGESKCYPVDKAVKAARLKYLETENLGEATPEQLQAYLDHMVEKVKVENQKTAEKEMVQ